MGVRKSCLLLVALAAVVDAAATATQMEVGVIDKTQRHLLQKADSDKADEDGPVGSEDAGEVGIFDLVEPDAGKEDTGVDDGDGEVGIFDSDKQDLGEEDERMRILEEAMPQCFPESAVIPGCVRIRTESYCEDRGTTQGCCTWYQGSAWPADQAGCVWGPRTATLSPTTVSPTTSPTTVSPTVSPTTASPTRSPGAFNDDWPEWAMELFSCFSGCDAELFAPFEAFSSNLEVLAAVADRSICPLLIAASDDSCSAACAADPTAMANHLLATCRTPATTVSPTTGHTHTRDTPSPTVSTIATASVAPAPTAAAAGRATAVLGVVLASAVAMLAL